MIVLTELQTTLIREAALLSYPNEMCGVLLKESFTPVRNIAEEPAKAFRMHPLELAKICQNESAVAIVHSHCRDIRTPEVFDTRTPSLADMEGQKASKIPWLIVATEGQTVTPPLQIPRIKNNNYVGRQFIWFINDCYTLVQDFYKFELGIYLPNHTPDRDYKELRYFSNLFDNYLTEYGFEELPVKGTTLQRGDLLLVNNLGGIRNHLVVFDGTALLHQDMLSVRVPLSTFAGRTSAILRYRG
jgi:proteasome lid subunit RPN8/RPN11